MTSIPDRLAILEKSKDLTGIDFVYVHKDQTTLDVYFLNKPTMLIEPKKMKVLLDPPAVEITCPSGGTPLSSIGVVKLAAATVEGRLVLRVTVATPGDFTLYRLRINDPRFDPYYREREFSFKAGCPSDLDCRPETPAPLPEAGPDFPVDYQARDFNSFRRALLDFAAQRYPDWKEKIEADAGVMFAEALSALGDELAYYQDRIGREAYLETATQRRSLRQHARLVDYPIHDGLGATGWLLVSVQAGMHGSISAGTRVCAESDDGHQTVFEVGQNLDEIRTPKPYLVDDARDALVVHQWDENDICVPAGSTHVFLEGLHRAVLTVGGKVMLEADTDDPAAPTKQFIVELSKVTETGDNGEELVDPLVPGKQGENPVHLTRIEWLEPLSSDMDKATLCVRGNVVPITAGATIEKEFVIGPAPKDGSIAGTVEHVGPNGSVVHLFSLPDSDTQQLVWAGTDKLDALPEVLLEQLEPLPPDGVTWEFKRSFLDAPVSDNQSRHYMMDDGTWKRVVGYHRDGELVEVADYASGDGYTLRFGDGTFGYAPLPGTKFRVTYRLGGGRAGNLPAGTVTYFEGEVGIVESVTNPLPTQGGLDPESPADIRKLAPDAFRQETHRAVRPEDYARAAERLNWVQRAGAQLRWTGSWMTVSVTPDPEGTVVLSDSRRRELAEQLERFRQAGRDTRVLDPRYVSIDLEIRVCVDPSSFHGEVKRRLLDALVGAGTGPESGCFFSADNFTFGTPLLRSKLEAAVQAVPGVRAVLGMRLQRRGWFPWRDFSESAYAPAADEVIRLENDPLHPERGSLRLIMEGGI